MDAFDELVVRHARALEANAFLREKLDAETTRRVELEARADAVSARVDRALLCIEQYKELAEQAITFFWELVSLRKSACQYCSAEPIEGWYLCGCVGHMGQELAPGVVPGWKNNPAAQEALLGHLRAQRNAQAIIDKYMEGEGTDRDDARHALHAAKLALLYYHDVSTFSPSVQDEHQDLHGVQAQEVR